MRLPNPVRQHLPGLALRGAARAWLAGLALSAQTASAEPAEARTEQVQARLIAAQRQVQPGQTLQVGVQQRIAPHWHTYWINPGDSGLATRIGWALPAGAQAGAIEWPVPSRFASGPITNYGYADEVTLLSTLRVPASLRSGDSFEVQARVAWLVCEQLCIPQEVVLGLSLPVGDATPADAPDLATLRQARERLPGPSRWPAAWQAEGGQLRLTLAGSETLPAHDGAYFYPHRWGQVVHAGAQVLQRGNGSAWHLALQPGEQPPQASETPSGVLVLSQGGRPVQAIALGTAAAPDAATPPAAALPAAALPAAALPATAPAPAPAADDAAPALSLGVALGLALLGGVVLNLMPCVFPVLSIKLLSLLGGAGATRGSVRAHGLAYTAGVLLSFAALAGVLVALQAGGNHAGWGFQFQSPVFVFLLTLLMWGVGLSLSGLFSVGASVAGVGQSLAARPGLAGSLFTGMLATVVATPCTAPFMGAAIGYALTQPAWVTLAVFLSLGLGLALPYLLLCEWPALQRRLPRPGRWMESVKQALAFPMYASAAWLAWVLAQQAGQQALAVALASAVALSFAAWLYGATRSLGPRPSRLAAGGCALLAALTIVGGAVAVGDEVAVADAGPTAVPQAARGGWEPYSPERLQALRAQGRPVFVNLTADWCITCLVNERVALGTDRVAEAFAKAGVVRLKGDWTRGDEAITRLLAEHGRSGVPLYLYYPAGNSTRAAVLPQLLSPQTVLAALAGPTPSP